MSSITCRVFKTSYVPLLYYVKGTFKDIGLLVNDVILRLIYVPYFLGCKTDFFSFQNNPKDLDPSYKMDLDL